MQSYVKYLRRNVTDKLLPGEGSVVLKLTHEVILFKENTKGSFFAVINITNAVLSILDEILSFPNSLILTNVSRIIFFIRTVGYVTKNRI